MNRMCKKHEKYQRKNVKCRKVDKLFQTNDQARTYTTRTFGFLSDWCDTKSLLKLLTAQIDFRMISGVTDTLMGSVKFIGCTLQ